MRGFQLGLVLVTILLLHSPALGRKPHRQVVLILDEEDEVKEASLDKEDVPSTAAEEAQDASDWDEFSDSDDSDSSAEDMDLGSWKSLLEHTSSSSFSSSSSSSSLSSGEALYRSGVEGMVSAASKGEYEILEASVKDFVEAADQGNAHAQSALGFMLGSGYGFNQSDSKAFLYHHFAAEGGSFHSKMALAYHYFRRQMNEEAAKLYAELAATAVASFWSSKDSLLIEPIRINDGLEENKEGLRKSRGEEDDDFQILEYQARKGNAMAMYKVGVFYYFGLRGVRRDHQKALDWFIKSVEKGESGAMELLGEIYARGSGVERNFTKALEWFQKAAAHKHFSAYNGIGYLYVKGLGVEKRNYTMALDYFKRAAENHNPNGYYNLGVLYLRGKGVKKDIRSARKNFAIAAKDGHLKAYYQLAKFFQKGLGVNKDLITATALFKVVAERGPWGSLLRWAVESYMKGDIGLALLLYTRAAELGYEVAQSNAAWILEKYPDVCLGKSGLCTDAERHQRAHLLWWHASEQGNDDAALLIGDAYYYGHGTEKDLERAAAAYQHARSQANAQAIFNLGYMHEHGLGLPLDLHLAKRYYDEALETDAAAALPVTLALASLWLRQHYGESFLITLIDALPDLPPKISEWTKRIILDEGNVTLMTLFACLLAVLYLKRRQRRRQMVPPPQAL